TTAWPWTPAPRPGATTARSPHEDRTMRPRGQRPGPLCRPRMPEQPRSLPGMQPGPYMAHGTRPAGRPDVGRTLGRLDRHGGGLMAALSAPLSLTLRQWRGNCQAMTG